MYDRKYFNNLMRLQLNIFREVSSTIHLTAQVQNRIDGSHLYMLILSGNSSPKYDVVPWAMLAYEYKL